MFHKRYNTDHIKIIVLYPLLIVIYHIIFNSSKLQWYVIVVLLWNIFQKPDTKRMHSLLFLYFLYLPKKRIFLMFFFLISSLDIAVSNFNGVASDIVFGIESIRFFLKGDIHSLKRNLIKVTTRVMNSAFYIYIFLSTRKHLIPT